AAALESIGAAAIDTVPELVRTHPKPPDAPGYDIHADVPNRIRTAYARALEIEVEGTPLLYFPPAVLERQAVLVREAARVPNAQTRRARMEAFILICQ